MPDFVLLTEEELREDLSVITPRKAVTSFSYMTVAKTALHLYARLREAERELGARMTRIEDEHAAYLGARDENERLREDLAEAETQLNMNFRTADVEREER